MTEVCSILYKDCQKIKVRIKMQIDILVIYILALVFLILNQVVFSGFKTRKSKDIRYIIQLAFLILNGYAFFRQGANISVNQKIDFLIQIIGYIIFLIFISIFTYKNVKTIIMIYTDYEPQFVILLIRCIIGIIIVFAIGYGFIYMLDNTSFKGINNNSSFDTYVDFIYFSFLTFTTIGFKDIAVSSFAKIMVVIEIIAFYLTIGAGVKYLVQHKKEITNKEKKQAARINKDQDKEIDIEID